MQGLSRSPADGNDDPFVTRLRRLTQIGEAELGLVEHLCSAARRVTAKTDLVREGDQLDRLHVVLDGWACRFKLLPDGRRQITSLLLPGDICDLDTLYLATSDYVVGTLTACTIATIDRSALRDLAARHPAIGEALGFLLAVDNAMLTERSACLGRRSAREHLAHFMCELMMRLTLVGRAQSDGFTLLLTQEEIGDALGLTSVHVNRVLQGLGSDGVIERRGHRMVIREWRVLRQIAAFRPGYLHMEDLDGSIFDLAQAPSALPSMRSEQAGFDARG